MGGANNLPTLACDTFHQANQALIGKLYSANPYVDVVVHTLWALIMLRPSTLETKAAGQLNAVAVRALEESTVSAQSRRELEAILYALRMVHQG